MIKTIAIDDEPLALDLLSRYIRQTDFLNFQGAFTSPVKGLEMINQEPVDLIFLDIRMPDISGIDFARMLNGTEKLVFTTAYDQYAIEGYKLHVVDYLLKPFSYEEFLAAATKAKKFIDLEQKATMISSDQQFLFIKSEYKIRRIRFADILYIEGLKDYAKIFMKHEARPILSQTTLKALESKLPERQFMRVHRSYIVNLDHVDLVERSHILFGQVEIPVSDAYKELFQAFLNENFL